MHVIRWLRQRGSVGRATLLLSSCALFACSQQRSPSVSRAPGTVQRAPSYVDAVRFLDQATFGATPAQIEYLQALGVEAWLEEQFSLPASSYPNVCCSGTVMGATCSPIVPCQTGDLDTYPLNPPRACQINSVCYRDNYTAWKLQNTFFNHALTAPDQLRQRVVFALSQILVASSRHNQLGLAHRFSPYLQALERNAFGNFRQLIEEITLNAAMGRFLDLIDNSVDQPNENYPRELLQLFTIGLFQLNPDGTPVLDKNGNLIPTYGQAEVVELTRALSGWALGAQVGPGLPNYVDPLRAIPARHDFGSKTIFGQVLPAGQTVQEDLSQSLDTIFNQPNVAPFIGKALIQMMVTSNPSAEYVGRVSSAFSDNGKGIRGDIKSVVRAILLDPEARNESPPLAFGKLREPVLSITGLLRAFDHYVTDHALSDFSFSFGQTNNLQQGQDVFRAPSVFNFFPPDFPVPGEAGLQGPEFGILSTTTVLARRNVYYQLIYNSMSTDPVWRPGGTRLDTAELLPLAGEVSALVEALNQKLLHGTMSEAERQIIVDTVSSGSQTPQQTVREAVYLVSTSSAFQVQR